MSAPPLGLGKLESVYTIAPAFMQRAVFTVALSFMFFLGMMFAYYIRQSVIYFLLASAFLVIYILTMISWVMQRRNFIEVHENGFKYKDRVVLWPEITDVNTHGMVEVKEGKPITVPRTLHESEILLEVIRKRAGI